MDDTVEYAYKVIVGSLAFLPVYYLAKKKLELKQIE
jgi:hypothetical protein